jgi:hypothetical protein
MEPIPEDPEDRVFTFILTWGLVLIVWVISWNW